MFGHKQTKFLSVILVLLIAASLLAACGSGGGSSASSGSSNSSGSNSQASSDNSGSSSSSGKVVTIQYWQYQYDARVKAMTTLIKQFNDSHPNIKVVMKTYPYDSYQQKLTAAIAAGQGPDVLQLYYGWLGKYIQGGFIQPLPTDAFPPSQIESDFSPVVASSKIEGKYWGLPTAVRTLALLYNKDLFKQAGLDPNKPPTTWAELVSDAQKMTKRDSSGKLLQEGFAFNTGGQGHAWFTNVLLPQSGVTPISADGKTVQWNSKPAAYDAFTWFTNLQKKYKVGDENFMSSDSAAFEAGKAAMTVDGSFRLGDIASKAPNLNFGVAELPVKEAGGKKVTFASYWTHAIAANVSGDKLKASEEFLKYISSPDAMKLWVKDVGELPARKSFATDPTLTNDPKLGAFVKGLAYAYTPFEPNESGTRQAIINATDKVLLKNVSPKAALDTATKQAQKTYDDFWSQMGN